MGHKWLTIILVLVLFLLDSGSIPTTATAKATDFQATFIITGIEDTRIGENVFPVPNGPKDPLKDGNDVIRWLIRNRHLSGIVLPPGDIIGTISFEVDGNLDTTQTGNLHGNFIIDTGPFDPHTLRGDGKDLITGNAEVKLVAGALIPYGVYFIAPVYATGHMVMQRGTDSLAGFHGQGQFQGAIVQAVLAFDATGGHVIGFIPSPVTITGKQT